MFSVRERAGRLNRARGRGILPVTMCDRGWVPLVLVLGFIALFASCAERAGDPVVRAGPALDNPAGGGGAPGDGAGGVPGEEAGAGGQSGNDGDPWGGLCSPCRRGRECGGRSDRCVELDDEERVCAQHCSDDDDCPFGYSCERVGFGSHQCLPVTGNCRHITLKRAPTTAKLREAALDAVNEVRRRYGLNPLGLDICLNLLAQASVEEFALRREAYVKFKRECGDGEHCECDWVGQAEARVAAFDLRWEDVVKLSIEEHRERSPRGSYLRTILTPEFTRLGVGVILSGDEGFSALSFGR